MDPLDDPTDHAITAIYYAARLPGWASSTLLIEPIAGPKRYRRVFLDQPAFSDDWTWHLPDHAVRLYPKEEIEP